MKHPTSTGHARMSTLACETQTPKEIALWAGDIVVCTEPALLTTVLGSCIAVCLFDSLRHFGGMNHYLLPTGGHTGKHGDWSTTELIKRMLNHGSNLANLQAKIFGGSSPLNLNRSTWSVGTANEAIARQILLDYDIPVVAERVGKKTGMRLMFENWSGTAWVRGHKADSHHGS